MGKKDKTTKTNSKNAPTSKQIPNRDNFARLNYLYQLSNHFTVGSSCSSSCSSSNQSLARGYDRNLDLLSKRTLSKLSPSVKRSICKKCHVLLIPGMTMSIRLENLSKSQDPKNDVFVNKCLNCGECKRFPIGADREYIPFYERGYIDEPKSGESFDERNNI
ncbi:hypothetical protein CANMA_002484 [Candida margitis]|uniref:uncharacterized protein n=1 Tax=Candida margitis TaxID=1775924 RepID=UPI002226E038|nr:uncharacterized protein CANMA_002484 [Candida margitis]KAI5968268.1 hypothetical protein CANMA_002484 [Candida margitis]